MAVAHEASTNNTTSGATSMTVAFPATVNSGDDLIISVVIDRDDAAGSTCDNGFTRLEESFNDQGTSSVYAAVFHKIATGSETGNATITFGNSANDGATAVMERYSGSDGSTTPPSSIGNNTASATPSAPGDVLSANTFRVVATVNYDSNGNRYSAVPTGYTLRQDLGNNGSGTGLASADQGITGDAATTYGDEAWTLTAGVNSVCISVALQEAAAGGAITKLVAETVNLQSGTIVSRGLTRLITGTVNISEAILRNLGLTRFAAETSNLVETTANFLGLVRSAAETVNINETLASFKGLLRLVSEVVNINDTALQFKGIVKLVSETINIVDSAVKLVAEAANAGVGWAALTILPKVQFILDYFGSKSIGKININDAGESDI